MLVKEKFYRLFLKIKKIIFLSFFLFFFSINLSYSGVQEELTNKYKSINTLTFNFTQKVGDKIETGNCYIQYSLLMSCEYPKKKKFIIVDGKKFAIVKKRYKKIYYYPLKKTPLYFLLDKEKILNLVKNYKPFSVNKDVIEYEVKGKKSSKLKIFFSRKNLDLLGWKTIDAYSNQVNFIIEDLKINLLIEENTFKIPKEEDL
jgi:outer membrane lipoprotein-sorting protein